MRAKGPQNAWLDKLHGVASPMLGRVLPQYLRLQLQLHPPLSYLLRARDSEGQWCGRDGPTNRA